MTWNTRSEYHRLAGASATPLADKLNTLGFGANAPARTIIRSPIDLTPRFRDRTIGDGALLTALMGNYYDYGRGHWSWTASSTGGVADGGLVKGNATHASTKTMVAFDLAAVSAQEAAAFNGPPDQVFEVQNVSEHFQARPDLNLNVGRWILISLGSDILIDGNNNRAFNKYLLTQQTKVGKSEIENLGLNSGRTSKRV